MMKPKTWHLSVFLLLVSPDLANASDCQFEKIRFSHKGRPTVGAFLVDDLRITLFGPDPKIGQIRTAEGPLSIAKVSKKGVKACKINSGIFSEVYISKKKKLFLTKTFSGNRGEFRLYGSDCVQIGKDARYCGNAELKGEIIQNSHPCENIGPNLYSCTSGHIFALSEKTREPILDTQASLKWTQDQLSLEVPFGKKFSNSGSKV